MRVVFDLLLQIVPAVFDLVQREIKPLPGSASDLTLSPLVKPCLEWSDEIVVYVSKGKLGIQ